VTLPKLAGIDHCHLNVDDLTHAIQWYQHVLGFRVVEELAFWNEDGRGPLTLEDKHSNIRLALFVAPGRSKGIAFAANGEQFIAWLAHFAQLNIKTILADHGVTFSIYFKDESGNSHEITSHDYETIKAQFPAVAIGSHAAKKSTH
jgi:catechol 2,3-dioxygenase